MSIAERQLRFRHLIRRAGRIGFPLLILTSLLDHAGAFSYRGDDWQRFDRQAVKVDRVIDDQSFESNGTVVRLLGVLTDQERATSFSESNLEGQKVVLRLDVPQTRDAAGELLAYAYLSPTDCWNVDLVRGGLASVDRQRNCSMLPELLAAQSARNKAIYRNTRKSHS